MWSESATSFPFHSDDQSVLLSYRADMQDQKQMLPIVLLDIHFIVFSCNCLIVASLCLLYNNRLIFYSIYSLLKTYITIPFTGYPFFYCLSFFRYKWGKTTSFLLSQELYSVPTQQSRAITAFPDYYAFR